MGLVNGISNKVSGTFSRKSKKPNRKRQSVERGLLQKRMESFKSTTCPVHLAIRIDDMKMLEALISEEADINKRDRNGDTPLILAVKESKISMVAKLLEEGADIHKNNLSSKSPLDIAFTHEDQECINLLAEHEISPAELGKSRCPLTAVTENATNFMNELAALLSNTKIVHW